MKPVSTTYPHMRRIVFLLVIILLIAVASAFYGRTRNRPPKTTDTKKAASTKIEEYSNFPLAIESMRRKSYPGSAVTVVRTLPATSSYHQYVVSYVSDSLNIRALLTIPVGTKPQSGWPVIIFNHGYIPPEVYKTEERYVAYVDTFAKNGYIVFKPDYRGHGESDGTPEGAYYSAAYATDVLNAVASMKNYPDANPERIGMWGHSMGGNITLRNVVVWPKEIKAAVIWGGVVGSYDDLMNNWHRKTPFQPSQREQLQRSSTRQRITSAYGTPATNPDFWQAIDPTAHLRDITTPIQLHAGADDEEVPADFSKKLYESIQSLGKTVEYFSYPGGDHNISSPNFEPAIQRSLRFFDTYLK